MNNSKDTIKQEMQLFGIFTFFFGIRTRKPMKCQNLHNANDGHHTKNNITNPLGQFKYNSQLFRVKWKKSGTYLINASELFHMSVRDTYNVFSMEI